MTDGPDHPSDGGGSDVPSDGNGSDVPSDGGDETREQMAAAIDEIRREGWKAAIVTGVVDATAVFLAANLALAVLEPARLPDRLALPASVTEPVGSALGRDLGSLAVPGSATVAATLGFAVFALVVWLRVRKPLVEQFEAVNPVVAEKLRTARDAVEADADSRMARRLYAEVLGDLRESSSLELVNVGRLGAVAVVIAALSLATIQVAVIDVALLDRPQPTDDGAPDESQNYTGLLDGERVLGDREEVSAGDNNQTAEIESNGGGRDVDEERTFPDRQRSGGNSASGGDGVDSQQAEFASPDQVEDAELVREYNRRIRDQDQGESSGDGSDEESNDDASGEDSG
ncbi:hypothetical protein ACFQMA_00925 [Halosimplex aquaticum]|uniref:Uncharacterized protein n=1 Tax=Halosimplex aquaticum TaxID=3026162 RepID=A0ABD5XTK2_9EURY|nr:hypothetical protein [Halosimplex aquaticum]